ncbi:divalent-cation tolerance protein CutA [Maricaulis sp.]|uniref:divalent-cation tolerance protein CutA n=1 Tax=Maricaulis sp. TaxID=1486257 RepID=UPI003A91715E
MSKYRWIYTTWPDAALAQQAAANLVSEGLCACANILPGMTSVYRWEGALETALEAVMIVKTTAGKASALTTRLSALHPYDEPCILGLDIDAAASSPGFLAWIGQAVSDGD